MARTGMGAEASILPEASSYTETRRAAVFSGASSTASRSPSDERAMGSHAEEKKSFVATGLAEGSPDARLTRLNGDLPGMPSSQAIRLPSREKTGEVNLGEPIRCQRPLDV